MSTQQQLTTTQSTAAISAKTSTGTTVTGTINSSSYSINPIPGNTNTVVTLTPAAGWTCSCPVGCKYSGLTQTTANVDFYVTNPALTATGWWQSISGFVLAIDQSITTTAVQSQIPSACVTPFCNPALVTKDLNNTAGSAGYALTGGGTINVGSGTVNGVKGLTLGGSQENFEYFVQQYSIDFTNSQADFNGTQPVALPTNGRAYIAKSDTTINTTWHVLNGQSYVVFVQGKLTVNAQITVDKGGFLAFITSGDITFAPTLGTTPTSTTSVADGVYVTDGNLIVDTTGIGDSKFVGSGTFVGWGGVQFRRQYANKFLSTTNPTELFIYRPDFMLNTPDRMKRAMILWQETN